MKLKISDNIVAAAGLAAILIAAANYFGITGIRTVSGMAVFFFLPFYIILRKLPIDKDEKFFFAFFLGLGLFSTAVFYAGRVIPSFRAAVIAAFVILLLLPFAKKLLPHKKSAES